MKYKQVKISLHTKLCLFATVILLAGGTLAFLIAEQQNVFRGAGVTDSLANAFFQAVTCRTAGFDTIAQFNLTEVSLVVTMLLMFIGACPGSTGGGIKATTAMTIMLLIINRFRGRSTVAVFKRTISNDSIIRALTVLILSFIMIIIALILFMFTEGGPLAHKVIHGRLGESLFEIISAYGTVGLSLGMTSQIHDIGKIIIIITMFAGRVGLLTLAFAFAKPLRRGEIVYAEEPVMTG